MSDMPRLHEREVPTKAGGLALEDDLWKLIDVLDLGSQEVLLLLADYETALLRESLGLPPVSDRPEGFEQVAEIVYKVRYDQRFLLTDVETMQAIHMMGAGLLKYMLGVERHPDDPDQPSGWA